MNISEIGGNAPNPKSNNLETNQTYKNTNTSIFNDKNGNNIVDAEDFDNNNALVSIVENAGWFNKRWDEVGKFVNNLLKNLSVNEANNVYDILTELSEKCDIKDGSNLTSVLCVISNENPNPEEREKLFAKIFKDEYQGSVMYKDGGSLKFALKDGTKVFQYLSIGGTDRLGWVVIVHKDGAKEVYNDEGEAQPPNSMDDVCEKYNIGKIQ